MRFVNLALYAEGPTDYEFLCPVLHNLCTRQCLHFAKAPVDVGPVMRLDHPETSSALPRERRIVDAARPHHEAIDILFVHTDGGGAPEAARTRLVLPAQDAVQREFSNSIKIVPVVPVRETESWIIYDGDALRQTFRTTLTDVQLGLPTSARHAELNPDPKSALHDAFERSRPSGVQRRQGTRSLLGPVGEGARVERLLELPSFQTLSHDLEAALRALRVIG